MEPIKVPAPGNSSACRSPEKVQVERVTFSLVFYTDCSVGIRFFERRCIATLGGDGAATGNEVGDFFLLYPRRHNQSFGEKFFGFGGGRQGLARGG